MPPLLHNRKLTSFETQTKAKNMNLEAALK